MSSVDSDAGWHSTGELCRPSLDMGHLALPMQSARSLGLSDNTIVTVTSRGMSSPEPSPSRRPRPAQLSPRELLSTAEHALSLPMLESFILTAPSPDVGDKPRVAADLDPRSTPSPERGFSLMIPPPPSDAGAPVSLSYTRSALSPTLSDAGTDANSRRSSAPCARTVHFQLDESPPKHPSAVPPGSGSERDTLGKSPRSLARMGTLSVAKAKFLAGCRSGSATRNGSSTFSSGTLSSIQELLGEAPDEQAERVSERIKCMRNHLSSLKHKDWYSLMVRGDLQGFWQMVTADPDVLLRRDGAGFHPLHKLLMHAEHKPHHLKVAHRIIRQYPERCLGQYTDEEYRGETALHICIVKVVVRGCSALLGAPSTASQGFPEICWWTRRITRKRASDGENRKSEWCEGSS